MCSNYSNNLELSETDVIKKWEKIKELSERSNIKVNIKGDIYYIYGGDDNEIMHLYELDQVYYFLLGANYMLQ